MYLELTNDSWRQAKHVIRIGQQIRLAVRLHTVNRNEKILGVRRNLEFRPPRGVAGEIIPLEQFDINQALGFRRGPDGFIWSFFDNTLVRIDPRDAKIEPVGSVSGHPVQIAFANGGVYVAGSGNLRKIKGLSVKNSK